LIRVNAEGKVVDGGPCRLLNAAGKISTSPVSQDPAWTEDADKYDFD
jgi:hypothetical protein